MTAWPSEVLRAIPLSSRDGLAPIAGLERRADRPTVRFATERKSER